MRSGLAVAGLAAAASLSACGASSTASSPSGGPTGSGSASVSMSPSPRASATSTPSKPVPVPDAESIAKVLLAMPHRPAYLSPYGEEIGGAKLGLGPDVRISGYRADPLFVCVQHVDLKADRAGAWTAYARDASGAVADSGASSGQCPTPPGSAAVRE